MSDSSTENRREDQLKLQKLELEIAALRTPFRRNPALWVTSATTVIAAAAFIAQLMLSQHEFTLSEQRAVLAEIKRERTLLDVERKAAELNSLNAEVNQARDELVASRAEIAGLRTATAELERENQFLRSASYVNSRSKEIVYMPSRINVAAWYPEGTVTNGQSSAPLLEHEFKLQSVYSDAGPYGVGDSTFVYAADKSRIVFTRNDFTDFINWKIALTHEAETSQEIRLTAGDDGMDHDVDYPFFEFANAADGTGGAFRLAWEPFWD